MRLGFGCTELPNPPPYRASSIVVRLLKYLYQTDITQNIQVEFDLGIKHFDGSSCEIHVHKILTFQTLFYLIQTVSKSV